MIRIIWSSESTQSFLSRSKAADLKRKKCRYTRGTFKSKVTRTKGGSTIEKKQRYVYNSTRDFPRYFRRFMVFSAISISPALASLSGKSLMAATALSA